MKIPKQLYITGKEQIDHDYVQSPSGEYNRVSSKPWVFGFLHAHEPNTKTDAKKKLTQMRWAYGDYWGAGFETVDGIVYEIRRNSRGGLYTDGNTRTPAKFQPQIWENTPLSEFIIEKFVSRERGNKFLRVIDPRGITVEISTACLDDIIANGTISKGVIQGECVWVGNKNLKLCSSL